MKEYIEERAVAIANYIIANNATVRQTAQNFGVSKSTVHKDCVERMNEINASLAAEVRKCWTSTNQNAIFGADLLQGKNIFKKSIDIFIEIAI